eukprot:4235759-Prymnesium_polylepis.1
MAGDLLVSLESADSAEGGAPSPLWRALSGALSKELKGAVEAHVAEAVLEVLRELVARAVPGGGRGGSRASGRGAAAGGCEASEVEQGEPRTDGDCLDRGSEA